MLASGGHRRPDTMGPDHLESAAHGVERAGVRPVGDDRHRAHRTPVGCADLQRRQLTARSASWVRLSLTPATDRLRIALREFVAYRKGSTPPRWPNHASPVFDTRSDRRCVYRPTLPDRLDHRRLAGPGLPAAGQPNHRTGDRRRRRAAGQPGHRRRLSPALRRGERHHRHRRGRGGRRRRAGGGWPVDLMATGGIADLYVDRIRVYS